MQVKILQGIPFLVDTATRNIYAYEKPITATPLLLGTYDTTTERFTLRADWQDAYKERLDAHRATEKPRSRVPAAAAPAK